MLFAEEALRLALPDNAEDILRAYGNLFRFGAQGPDFFYHNQRTMPTGLRYGVATHRSGFGTLVAHMVKEARRLKVVPASDLSAFLLGFVTHAALDRTVHPFIGYFAGWVDPKKRETQRLFHCHPFLERILDVIILRERYGKKLEEFDFLGQVVCGRTLPYPVVKALVKGLNATYPAFSYKSRNRRRIENAYRDTIYFYKISNHLNPDLRKLAFKKDRQDGFRVRRLGLLHPQEPPEGFDFANRERKPWCHPCDEKTEYRKSFFDLYEEAFGDAAEALKAVFSAITSEAFPEDLADRIGNTSLDTGREPCPLVFSDPLPLPEILESMYRKIEKELSDPSCR